MEKDVIYTNVIKFLYDPHLLDDTHYSIPEVVTLDSFNENLEVCDKEGFVCWKIEKIYELNEI